MTPPARRRLTHLLLCKSIFEVLFVAALAVGFHYVNFHSDLRGSLDRADARQATGWVIDESRPDKHIEVQLYVDGNFAANTRANRERRDVQKAGRAADDWHGFVFDMPALSAGEHEARVYALRGSDAGETKPVLQLVGHPLRFRVEAATPAVTEKTQNVETKNSGGVVSQRGEETR